MVSDSDYKCWEIMNCDNIDCPARREPETPCWEIAKEVEACHKVSNTCRDCVVYILKREASILSINKLQNLIEQRDFWRNIGTRHQCCIL